MLQSNVLNRASLIGETVGKFIFALFIIGTDVTFGQDLNSVNHDSSQVVSQIATLPDSFEIVNLGDKINSKYGDYRPRITTDGTTLYFCRRIENESAKSEFTSIVGVSWEEYLEMPEYQRKRKIKKVTSEMDFSDHLNFILLVTKIYGKEDIYVSHLVDNEWTPAERMGSELNTTDNNEAPESISTDNNQFFIFKNGDVYLTKRNGEQWGAMEKIPEPINSIWWDGDICFSSDGVTLFFVSLRPGFTTSLVDTAKNRDIWVSVKNEFGWGAPINLGPTINTPKSERTPFLHSDGETLYFASNGHGGEGQFDLFKTTRIGDSTWTDWTEPINLARLNTAGDDWDLSMPANSIWGYFISKQKTGFGKDDIYKFRVDSTIAPKRKVTLITGVVTSTEGDSLESEIRWEDLKTGNFIGKATSNKKTGKYTIALPAGRKYGYYATKDKYWDKSANIDLTNLLNYNKLTINIQLSPILSITSKKVSAIDSAGPEVVLNNIFFDFDSDSLNTASYSELNRLAEKLSKYEKIKIEVQGHTDSVGTDEYNKVLSQNRANTVRSYLISKNIDTARLTAVGYGEDQPIADNRSDEGRQSNRRVSFVEIRTVAKK